MGPWRSAAPPEGFTPFPDQAMQGSVVDRFLEAAEQYPQNVAVSSPAGRWTYSELADRVRRTASALIARVDPSEARPVGLLADHDGPLVVAMLSIIASGHIVVVIDPTAPAEQVDHVLVESGIDLLVHDQVQAEAAADVTGRHERVTAVSLDELSADPVELPGRGPGDPVMLAFTSGTSGSPKGGIITHGVILNVVRGATNALGVTAEDRMPMLFPTSLAVAAYPMFIPLLNGGTLATLDVRGVGLNPIAPFLAEERITLAYMAPTVVRFLVDAIGDHTFPDLRMIALGGELVDAEVVALTTTLFAPEMLANGFGTTETGVISLYVIDRDEPFEGTVPSGYSVEEVELMVLDDNGQQVAAGESGEIAVASPHVFKGYWGHDELNRTVLSDDPRARPDWRLYRTGDLGRLDEHGALVVLGRLDTKVKVRGRFVVLGDVEASLHELEAVADAAVVPTRRDGNVELCAVVVPAGGESLDPTALRAQLLERQEAYRVPARWVVVDELPRLPNGKVDRRALPISDASGASGEPSIPGVASAAATAGESTAPSQVQRTLRDIWELLLPVEVVGPDDDFMALGGDSLLAAQMLVMVEQRVGVTVPMGELVNARTLRDLSDVVVRIQQGAPTTTTSCVQAGDESARPRLWFVHDLQGSAYRVRHVARHLGADQPVWSFESPLLAGEPNRFRSLDTFAANYLTDLLREQPEGPYWLGGYSFGGICAYEMARQLRREGREVAFVGVVDVGPGYRGPGWSSNRSPFRPWFGVQKPPPDGATTGERARHYLDMVKRSPAGAARHLMVRTGLARVIDPLRFRADLRREGRVRPEWRLWYAWEEHWKLAAKAWDRASSYDGRMDLFWADDTASADATMGWGPLVSDLAIHRFPGDHEGLLEPRGAEELARTLRVAIDERLGER
jgi:amino acid adenylation domain-containing protein